MLGDSGYGSGATRAALRAAGHAQTIKPMPLQSAVPGGFTIHDFRIDRQAGPSGVRRATPRRSPARARPALPAGVSTARCASAALPPSRGARSGCIGTRTSCAPPAAKR